MTINTAVLDKARLKRFGVSMLVVAVVAAMAVPIYVMNTRMPNAGLRPILYSALFVFMAFNFGLGAYLLTKAIMGEGNRDGG